MRTLTVDEARKFYDRFGAKQDRQVFYERKALESLVQASRFGDAQSVFEFGCGTGRLALELLERHLSPACRYLGIDVSSTMIGISSTRLAPHAARASAILASGDLKLPLPDVSVDRFVSTYVLDLLSDSATLQLLAEARRVLDRHGLLCVAGISRGTTPLSRAVMSAWQWLFRQKPSLVGGCRPIRLADMLHEAGWKVDFQQTVVSWGVASEVIVAVP